MLPEKKKSIFIKSEIVIIQIFVLRYEQQRTLLIPSKKNFKKYYLTNKIEIRDETFSTLKNQHHFCHLVLYGKT